ncbi:multiple C2 and transmembrane domain-containing protein-like [Oppia nitens]|uniref:multiple C2 and transmembrane domain-containing protein-like n=1 Tax=Oppia nitens TaxID=1686743 RepID=UPI0023DC524D|nr:multiple C2 and transmembrane domain-containing protein-like [Oppia nitens]
MDLDDSNDNGSDGCCHNSMSRPYLSSVCPQVDCYQSSLLKAVKRNNSCSPQSSPQRHYNSSQLCRRDSICTDASPQQPSSPTGTKKLKKIQTIWSTIKRFSPVHRIKNYNKRKLDEKTERLYSSHPDISYSNLVVLTQIENQRSRDDTDAAIALTKSKSKTTTTTANNVHKLFAADSNESNCDVIYTMTTTTTTTSANNSKLINNKMDSLDCENCFSIKRFSPVHRIKNYNKRKLDEKTERLYSSHPDISYSNLVVLTQIENQRSRDDTDAAIALTKSKSKTTTTTANNVHKLFAADSNESNCDVIYTMTTTTTTTSANNSKLINNKMDSLDCENELALSRQRVNLLRQHPFYHLEVHLVCATNLLAKDACGTSDPYVKFKIGNKIVYKSRIVAKCLDPKWDEYFVLPIDDVFQPIIIKAYDYDFGFQDDYLGAASIDLTKLDLQTQTDLELKLTESGLEKDIGTQSWGEIFITVTLIGKTLEEKEMHYNKGLKIISSGSGSDTGVKKPTKIQLWDSVVNIVLVEAKNVKIKDDNTFGDLHIKFKLGSDKYKSKVVPKSANPVWVEQFDLNTYLDQSKVLEFSLWSREEISKATINLNDLVTEETHKMWINLDDGSQVMILLTISATLGSEAVSHLSNYEINNSEQNNKVMLKKYTLLRSLRDINDIGFLIVKVYRAENLAAADIGGKSDPFCVLELVNTRLRTHTEYKTLSPDWNKVFTFNVTDIHSVLELTVYDEDRDKKVEFLGKVAIPLLKIKNGEKKWFALKDKKLLSKAKGQILLEMDIYYNKVKASIRTFNPRESKFIKPEQRFKRIVFIRNVTRIKNLVMEIYEIIKFMNSCFQWESVSRSILSLILFLLFTYFFELYMAPVLLLLIFSKTYIWIKVENYFNPSLKEEEIDDEDEASFDDEDDETKNEEKKSLKEKLQTVQEITAMIQNIMGEIASCGERIKNTFNFSVPFLSWLAIISLTIVTILLYNLPLRYIIMAWGVNKWTKKLRSPDAINNNELMDFLSRVPDNDERVMYREYKVHANTAMAAASDIDRKKKKKTV